VCVHRFAKVEYFGVPQVSVDTISFPAKPTVLSVRGCTDVPSLNSTIDCPTNGSVDITITGTNFFTPLTVYVGGSKCDVHLDTISQSQLTCVLPSGVGFLKAVVVTVLQESSVAQPLLSVRTKSSP